jgi:membrane-associated phospholipid phosphatase
LLVIVATGNHFFLDAAAGALVAGLAVALAALLMPRPTTARR